MIAVRTNSSDTSAPACGWARFLEMLPQIHAQARVAFRGFDPERREDLIQEVVANTFVAFTRLVARRQEERAFPSPLAQFAIRQIRCGRRVGARLNRRDVTSPCARVVHGLSIERLDHYDLHSGEWKQTVVEDRTAGPAETAAARLDLAAWFNSLSPRQHQIAEALARGETTGSVARLFRVSPGRISQLRLWLARSWERFQEAGRDQLGRDSRAGRCPAELKRGK